MRYHNPADIFTKGPSSSLPVHRFKALRDIVMGRRPVLYLSGAGVKSMNLLLDQVRWHWPDGVGVPTLEVGVGES